MVTRIGVVFGPFNEVAKGVLSYLLVFQNTLQKSFEFIMVPCPKDDPFIEMLLREPAPKQAEVEQKAEDFFARTRSFNESAAKRYEFEASQFDKFVLLSHTALGDYSYYVGDKTWAIIALGGWENQFAPPSIVEYYLTLVVGAAIDGVADLPGHFETRGCILDFNGNLSDARFSALTGHLCEVCEHKIKTQTSGRTLGDAQILLARRWLGDSSSPSEVAVTVEKMGYNLFRTAGIKQTLKQRWLGIIEQEGIKNILNLTFQIILVAALIALNLKSRK